MEHPPGANRDGLARAPEALKSMTLIPRRGALDEPRPRVQLS
ncbi:hypothetical protein ACS5PK_06565 [Roseateles sp. DB2]